MNKKLIVYLLVVCLTFSFGIAQAQDQGNDESQNMTTTGNVSTLANKTLNVSQQEGGDVKWILPGLRRLDPQIFGTPDMPLGFEPEIGVPVENRTVSGNMFNTTTMPTPISDNFTRINGSFMMDLSDETPVDVNQSRDAALAEFNFTDPTGEINYRVVLTEITRVGQFHPVFGGVVIDGIAHGKTGIDTRLGPTSYVYGAVWGVGELYINDTLVSDNRVIHAMATERVRSPDQQGYRLLFDNELPHRGIQAHLVVPDMIMAENGTMVEEPVPTNFTLPNGQEQPFLHIAFDNPQMQGLEVLNFNNATMMTGNMTGNTTGNMTDNMTGNATGEITEVSIEDFAFDPESVTISVGDTVRWTNMDSEAHTVTSSIFDSGRLEEEETYEFTFTEPGTVEYYCSIHPSMQGNVTVMEEDMTGGATDIEDEGGATGDGDNNAGGNNNM